MSAINRTEFPLPKVWNKNYSKYVINPLQLDAAKRAGIFQLPEDKAEWEKMRKTLYNNIASAMKLKVDHSLPLDYEETGSIRQDGFTIKKISFRASADRYVTANLYVPDGEGPFPAVVNVHGHWSQGKIAARVQARGHILAKEGYVCLTVDAFGAGERASIHGKFEYHGMFLGASLLNVGETLMGVQVADNMRAVDLLQSLPYVDGEKIGVTGASGGGNQTMYIAALDERVKAAVPVCSVGSYDSYVRSANCFCELMPGGLNFTEEAGVIALVAPRAIKICSANEDGECFSPREMLNTFNEARKVFQAYGVDANLENQIFAGGHGYWPENLESAIGFFDLHLKGIGHGNARKVPDYIPLPEEDLMVYEAGKKPEKLKSMRKWTSDKAVLLAEKRKENTDPVSARKALEKVLVGNKKLQLNSFTRLPDKEAWARFVLDSGDVMTPVLFKRGTSEKCYILASDKDKQIVASSRIFKEAMQNNDSIIIFDPYGSGETYDNSFSLWAHPDYHNLTRFCAWLGFSLLGVWTQQYNLIADWAKENLDCKSFVFGGIRDAGIASLCASSLSGKAEKCILEGSVISLDLVSSNYTLPAATLALAVPDILLYGDVTDFIALANGKVALYAPVHGDGTRLTQEEFSSMQQASESLAESSGTKCTLEFME